MDWKTRTLEISSLDPQIVASQSDLKTSLEFGVIIGSQLGLIGSQLDLIGSQLDLIGSQFGLISSLLA